MFGGAFLWLTVWYVNHVMTSRTMTSLRDVIAVNKSRGASKEGQRMSSSANQSLIFFSKGCFCLCLSSVFFCARNLCCAMRIFTDPLQEMSRMYGNSWSIIIIVSPTQTAWLSQNPEVNGQMKVAW